jgi:hypothetical protein
MELICLFAGVKLGSALSRRLQLFEWETDKHTSLRPLNQGLGEPRLMTGGFLAAPLWLQLMF